MKCCEIPIYISRESEQCIGAISVPTVERYSCKAGKKDLDSQNKTELNKTVVIGTY